MRPPHQRGRRKPDLTTIPHRRYSLKMGRSTEPFEVEELLVHGLRVLGLAEREEAPDRGRAPVVGETFGEPLLGGAADGEGFRVGEDAVFVRAAPCRTRPPSMSFMTSTMAPASSSLNRPSRGRTGGRRCGIGQEAPRWRGRTRRAWRTRGGGIDGGPCASVCPARSAWLGRVAKLSKVATPPIVV